MNIQINSNAVYEGSSAIYTIQSRAAINIKPLLEYGFMTSDIQPIIDLFNERYRDGETTFSRKMPFYQDITIREERGVHMFHFIRHERVSIIDYDGTTLNSQADILKKEINYFVSVANRHLEAIEKREFDLDSEFEIKPPA